MLVQKVGAVANGKGVDEGNMGVGSKSELEKRISHALCGGQRNQNKSEEECECEVQRIDLGLTMMKTILCVDRGSSSVERCRNDKLTITCNMYKCEIINLI